MIVEETARARKELQDAIYRERILRARAMTPAERLVAAFECSDFSLKLAHGVAMSQKKLTNEDEGWEEVGRRVDRLRRLHDQGFYQPVDR